VVKQTEQEVLKKKKQKLKGSSQCSHRTQKKTTPIHKKEEMKTAQIFSFFQSLICLSLFYFKVFSPYILNSSHLFSFYSFLSSPLFFNFIFSLQMTLLVIYSMTYLYNYHHFLCNNEYIRKRMWYNRKSIMRNRKKRPKHFLPLM
jgi:Ca2+-dependent lipid-binding protein